MKQNSAKALAILAIFLLGVSFASYTISFLCSPKVLIDIGTFDFILRTGGTLHEPNTTIVDFPLTQSMNDPGNMTISEISSFAFFGIYYQVVLGLSVSDNGSSNENPRPLPRDAEYDMWLSLNASIEISSPLGMSSHVLDRIILLRLNESMS